jgi:stage II sporulation protein P
MMRIKKFLSMLLIAVLLFCGTAYGATKTVTPTAEPQKPKPVIYIYHTHAHETYADGTSVIEVGKALAAYLTETYGIEVIHDTTNYSEKSLAKAYETALKDVQAALKENPQITCFLDIHRDVGTNKLIHEIGDEEMAPVTFVVGRGEAFSGGGKPSFERNYAFALAVYEKLTARSMGLALPLIEKDGRYNQHLPGLCALIELGLNKNTYKEAANTVPYLAEAIAIELGAG